MNRALTMMAVLALVASAPVGFPSDFNGDGTEDIGIFRPDSGLWAIRGVTRAYFGDTRDKPVPGDYDGNGSDEIAIFRPDSGLWAIQGGGRYYFGDTDDLPLTGCGGGYLRMISSGELIVSNPLEVNSFLSCYAPLYCHAKILIDNGEKLQFKAADASTGAEIFCYSNNNLVIDAEQSGALIKLRTENNDSQVLVLDTDGKVGIGTDTPTDTLHIKTDRHGYGLRIFNDGNDSNRYGIRVRCGADDGSGTNYLVWFADGDDTHVGDITFTGGNVAYNNFTAEHTAKLPEEDNENGYPYGTVVRLVSKQSDPDRPRQDRYTVRTSVRAYDKEVFGIYAGKRPDEENNHSIYAIGDGHILVTREGGNIESGDYLTTSSKPGHAMKQNDDLRHGYTVAKALEEVDWAKEEGDSKLIGCTYQTQ